ncbi:hypothetical protein JI752_007015 [Lysobacter sp. MMG2]|uniref:hypothetical protein n=1 Tax=Lysobacter sp. MMG2 TaxID=2801338 RepID=UPI001C23BB54|nr:hypothetical protein [Lysobacter sp. MMG2]MBU8975891.1 hypothetical protein [Lysobacter sp. MMG2]
MKLNPATIALLATLPWLVGFAESELKTYPDDRPNPAIIEEAVARGATSCRYNLEDMLIHALGDREGQGVAFYPVGDEKRRPYMGLYVTTYPNGDQAHLQWVAGPDASGLCALSWTEARHWKQPCKDVVERYVRDRGVQGQPMGEATLLTSTSPDNGLKVVATPAGDGCLVTESDIAWRLDPDEKAREWIQADHGYDPGP